MWQAVKVEKCPVFGGITYCIEPQETYEACVRLARQTFGSGYTIKRMKQKRAA